MANEPSAKQERHSAHGRMVNVEANIIKSWFIEGSTISTDTARVGMRVWGVGKLFLAEAATYFGLTRISDAEHTGSMHLYSKEMGVL